MTRARTAKLLSLVGVAILAACSSSRRIDGSSAATFERSVAMLQNDLPSGRREDFDAALAVTFMRAAALDSGDLDADGDVDDFDARIVSQTATNLLAEIERGNLTSAVEESKGPAVAAAYFKQLDGLAYDEVIELAGEANIGPYLAIMRQLKLQAACAQQQVVPELRGFESRISARCANR